MPVDRPADSTRVLDEREALDWERGARAANVAWAAYAWRSGAASQLDRLRALEDAGLLYDEAYFGTAVFRFDP